MTAEQTSDSGATLANMSTTSQHTTGIKLLLQHHSTDGNFTARKPTKRATTAGSEVGLQDHRDVARKRAPDAKGQQKH